METTIQQHCEDCLPEDHSGLNFFLKAVLTTLILVIAIFLIGFYMGRYTANKPPTEIQLPKNTAVINADLG
jgi:hypothetical protein